MKKINLEAVLFIFTILFSNLSMSSEKIICTAKYLEFLNDGSTISEIVALESLESSEYYIQLSADLRGKNFSLSGDIKQNTFYVSITDLPDYTQGSITTAAFSNDHRLQLSIVNKNTVYKLECFKN